MASGFQGLVDGSCGNVNPLMRLTTHFTEDKAKTDFQRRNGHQLTTDKLSQFQSSRAGESDLVDEFLRSQSVRTIAPINSFNMKNLLREVQPRHMEEQRLDGLWSHEFLESFSEQQKANQSSQSFLEQSSTRYQVGNVRTENSSRWASEYLDGFDHPEIHADHVVKNPAHRVAEELYDVLDKDTKFSKSEFKSFLKNIGQESEGDSNWAEEFKSKNMDSSWANEFSEFTDTDFETFIDGQKSNVAGAEKTYTTDFWENLEEQWRSSKSGEGEDLTHRTWADDFASGLSDNDVITDDYRFQPDNPLMETKDCLETGKLKLAEGDLPSAVLLFEAAAQQQPDNPEVWFLLGTSQAKNEQDPAAISALRKSLALDPINLDAILALAASLTNESNQVHACYALKDWITANPKYSPSASGATPSLESLTRKMVSSFMTREQHQETMDLYLRAARINHQAGQVDPDVQGGLGILFNLSGDYDKAADCFKAALGVKPDDLLLWNRLGATLANGNRSEEAISAYHEALRLYPGFVRSRYNLGISCLNLKAYREAVEHFLTGLNFQAAGRGPDQESGPTQDGPMSDSIWGSLRLGLSLMGRTDLYREVESRNLKVLNKEFQISQS